MCEQVSEGYSLCEAASLLTEAAAVSSELSSRTETCTATNSTCFVAATQCDVLKESCSFNVNGWPPAASAAAAAQHRVTTNPQQLVPNFTVYACPQSDHQSILTIVSDRALLPAANVPRGGGGGETGEGAIRRDNASLDNAPCPPPPRLVKALG